MRTFRTLAIAALLAALTTVGATSASAAQTDVKIPTSATLSWGWGG